MNNERAKKILRPVTVMLLVLMAAGCTSLEETKSGRITDRRLDRATAAVSRQLELTREQKTVLEQTLTEISEYIAESSVLSDEERAVIKSVIAAEEPDTDTLLQIRAAHADEILQMRTEIMKKLRRFHSVLDKHQREILADMIAER